MSGIGQIGYLAGAVGFAVLGVALLTVWRGKLNALLPMAVGATMVWCLVLAAHAGGQPVPVLAVYLAELARDAFLLVFLVSLIMNNREAPFVSGLRIFVHALWIVLLVVAVARAALAGVAAAIPVFLFGFFAFALSGLVVTEQVYRNTSMSQRWAIKFLCLGIGGLFAFDLVIYAKGIMFRGLDPDLWSARGYIHLLVTPLIGLSVARSEQWSAELMVSRQVAFYTTTLFAAGMYLLAMAAGGYYVRIWGGDWGAVAQAIFVFGAVVLLAVMFVSGQFRARLRVFLNKHFFRYKYDYREEWLRLTRLLSAADASEPLPDRAIISLADPVESPGGALWLKKEPDSFDLVARWNFKAGDAASVGADDSLVLFLAERNWVVDIGEYRRKRSLYGLFKLPHWLAALDDAWLVVPLMQAEELTGFVVLAKPRAPQALTWEDLDLLKTVGQQVAGYLALDRAAGMLAEARQFEAFNRFTAFIMHDLKNLIAQQSLVVKNAARHKHNPEFIEDAISTVDNSVRRMSRLLEQLRQGGAVDLSRRIAIADLCAEVAEQCSARQPQVNVEVIAPGLQVRASRDGLATVLGHVVRNAQDAAGAHGNVSIRVAQKGQQAVVDVVDDGTGMDEQFVRERLFRPFESTKGSKGMGIGAYQAREFVRAAGGDIAVDSTPGQGTVFTLMIPLAESVSDQTTQKSGAMQ
ncbi:MAG: PEP-CTERM system histidine kinase PrsK [Gammaproteobacteria bacterium]|nr:PEP-CTERM system histidine kinase PrsK [Gammaproteobacteria bacterium]NNF59901.1 PEP-CTERM system histidine kinase PrsK [Gammaproteobacteria bacterium]NNM21635.1 PEP-CTERM system histidine kinase PrsK [Gammaproteobacteria bacterium]